MLLDMHFADLHNEYYLSKLKVLDFSHDCCELSIIPDLHFFLKSGDELIVVKATMRRGFINLKLYSFKHKKKTQRFRNERYMSNYLLRGSYFMSVQDSSLLFDFKFGWVYRAGNAYYHYYFIFWGNLNRSLLDYTAPRQSHYLLICPFHRLFRNVFC